MDDNEILSAYQKEIRCPIHKTVIGKYDERAGLINVAFYCEKCGMEYTFTFTANRTKQKKSKNFSKRS